MRDSDSEPTGLAYRPDIDGLRAIAVLSVVFYHFGIGGLRGGFVGVDVFFVISGYLITGIIHREMKHGEFTLARFYERRARRIFPALFVVLLVTMIASLWILLPGDLAMLGKASAATILFASNVLFLLRSGYFDSSSDFNPLLHTWSLGVEEQFYFGLPVLMLLVARFWSRGLVRILAISAMVSFALCVFVQPLSSKATFFLSPFRGWELLLGSLLGIRAIPGIRNALIRNAIAVLAICTLLGSVAVMEGGIDYPGWKAAIPVLATAMLLHVGECGGSRVGAALAWKPLVFVGLISYSLYLWHWPVLVLAKYGNGMESLSTATSLALLSLTFILAIASYYFIERPFRKAGWLGASLSRQRVFAASTVAAVALLVVGFSFAGFNGFPSRVPTDVAEFDQARFAEIPFATCHGTLPGEKAGCKVGGQGHSLALIWGDSHALALAPGMDQALTEVHWEGALAVEHACAPLIGLDNSRNLKCKPFNDRVVEWIEDRKPARIYMVANWFAWSNSDGGYDLVDIASGAKENERIFGPALARTIERVRPYAKEIVVVGPTPGAVDGLPYKLAMARWKHLDVPEQLPLQNYRERSENFWAAIRSSGSDLVTLNPEQWFCNAEGCRYLDGDQLLYRDGNHLSLAGARFAAAKVVGAEAVGGAGR